MPVLKHLHTYKRVEGKKDVFMCIHPDCAHWKKKELLMGKRAQCGCGAHYTLGKYELSLKLPHCEKCTQAQRNPAKMRKTPRIFVDNIDLSDLIVNKEGNEDILNARLNEEFGPLLTQDESENDKIEDKESQLIP